MPDQFWQEWVKLLGVLAVPLGILIWAIAWLMKSIVTHALSRDIVRLGSESAKEIEQMKILSTREIEEIKIKLLHEAELSKIQLNTKLIEELEQLKSNLTIIMKEHEIRFSGLHRERAETIKNLRSKIVDAYYESMHFSNEIGSALDSKLPFIEEKEGKVSDNELVERLKEPYEKSWSKIGEASAYALQNSVYFQYLRQNALS